MLLHAIRHCWCQLPLLGPSCPLVLMQAKCRVSTAAAASAPSATQLFADEVLRDAPAAFKPKVQVMAKMLLEVSGGGGMARRHGKEAWQGGMARRHGKEAWQGGMARRHGKELPDSTHPVTVSVQLRRPHVAPPPARQRSRRGSCWGCSRT